MGKFEVPRQAVEQLTGENPAPVDEVRPAEAEEDFAVSQKAVHELDGALGDTSEAAELIGNDEGPAETEPTAPRLETTVESYIARRNQLLNHPDRNMSYLNGDTMHTYYALSERRRKKVGAIGRHLLARYKDRGVSERTVGLIYGNPQIGYMMTQGGGGMWDAEDYDEYWVVHLGVPLEDQVLTSGRRESEQSHIRYRGRKRSIVNFMDTELIKYPWGSIGETTVPQPVDTEWLPAIRVY